MEKLSLTELTLSDKQRLFCDFVVDLKRKVIRGAEYRKKLAEWNQQTRIHKQVKPYSARTSENPLVFNMNARVGKYQLNISPLQHHFPSNIYSDVSTDYGIGVNDEATVLV